MSNKIGYKVSVLLPQEDYINSGYSVANWVQQVFTHPVFNTEDIHIFGRWHSQKASVNSKWLRVEPRWFSPKIADRIGKWFPKYQGYLWVLFATRKLRAYELIIVENRPEYAIMLRKFGFRGKIILHLHNDRSTVGSVFIKKFLEASDLIVACSQHIVSAYAKKVNEFKHKSVVIPEGVDVQLFKPIHGSLKEDYILFVGRQSKAKGLDLLLEALKVLKRSEPELSIVIVGPSPSAKERAEFERLFEELINLHIKVDCLGPLSHNDGLPEQYRKAKLVCMPSSIPEGFGMVIIEALASGTAVVATDMGGIKEALGECGVLTKADAASIANAIGRILSDDNLRAEYERAGRHRAETMFSWIKIANSMHGLLYTFCTGQLDLKKEIEL